MAYTVKQLAALSGVSVRTLHFYDETGLLKPARHGANGYRFYEDPQLLILQQILFYRHRGDVVEPRHLHDQDEWIYILGGDLQFDVYQPASRIEEFYRELGKYNRKPYIHEVLSLDEFRQIFRNHGMDLTGPPLLGEWKVENGRIKQLSQLLDYFLAGALYPSSE